MKTYFSELIGTFILVFVGTSAIVVNEVMGGQVTHVGVALVFGLVVSTIIYAIGDISGAHINPAVTFGFWIAKRFPGKQVFPYVVSQTVGAILASKTVFYLFTGSSSLGATLPSGSVIQAFILEIILTFILMFTVINVSTGAREKGISAGIAIGGVVALAAIFAGPITGASMNPARSIGPALVSGNTGTLWLYLVAPVIGPYFGIMGCRCIREKECCR